MDEECYSDHLEFPVTDILEAKEFYSEVFGWGDKMQDWGDEYVLVTVKPDTPSFGIGLVKKMPKEKNQVIIVMRTPDIEETLKRVKKAGGKITREKFEIDPEVGHGAYFEDIFGNVWGLHSPPKQ